MPRNPSTDAMLDRYVKMRRAQDHNPDHTADERNKLYYLGSKSGQWVNYNGVEVGRSKEEDMPITRTKSTGDIGPQYDLAGSPGGRSRRGRRRRGR